MHGLYANTLELGAEGAIERPDPAVLALLTRPAPPATHPRLVPIVVEDGALRVRADLSSLLPLSERPTVERLLVVTADVLGALRALRAAGRAHGDLRLAHLWYGPDGGRLTCPAPVEPGPLAMARMRAGTATADALAFVAPELIAGGPATPEGDVFALAATLYAALVGRPPLGALERLDGYAIPAGLRELIRTGLLQEPTARPGLEAFAAVLEAHAQGRDRPDSSVERATEETGDFEPVRAEEETGDFEPVVDDDALPGVPRTTGGRAVAAEIAAAERLSPLVVVLAIGGLFTVAGAALLAFQGLQGGSALEALVPLFFAAALLGGGGAGLLRAGHATSGRALILVALQVGWAIAGASFRLAGIESAGLYGLVGAVIGGANAALAITWRSGPASGLAAISFALAALLSVNALLRGQWALMPVTAAAITTAPATFGLVAHALRGPVVGRPPFAIALLFAALGLLGLSLDNLSPRTLPAVFAAPWLVTALGVAAVVALERAREQLGASYRAFAAAAVGLGACATAPMHLLAGGEPRELAGREALCLGAALLVVGPRWRNARANPLLLSSALALGALNAAAGLIDVSRSLPWREALGAWFGVTGALTLSVAHATRSQLASLGGTSLAAVAAVALAWRAPEDAAVVTLALATPLLVGAALLLREGGVTLARAPLGLAGLLLCASAATGVVGRSPWWPHIVFVGGAPVLWLVGRNDLVLGVGGLAVAALGFTVAASATALGDPGTVAVAGVFGAALAALSVRGVITPRALVGACAGVTASLAAWLHAGRVSAPVDQAEVLALVTLVGGALLAVVMALTLSRPEEGRTPARCVEVAALLPPTFVLGLGAVLHPAEWSHLLALLVLGLAAAAGGIARRHLAAATVGLVATLVAGAIGYVTHVLPAAPVPVTLLVGGLTIMGLGVAAEVGVRRRLDSFAAWA